MIVSKHGCQELWICFCSFHEVLQVARFDQSCHNVLIKLVILRINIFGGLTKLHLNDPGRVSAGTMEHVRDLVLDLDGIFWLQVLNVVNHRDHGEL